MDISQDTLIHYHEIYSDILQAEYDKQQRQLARIDELTLEVEAEQRMDAERSRAAKRLDDAA